MAFSQPEFTSEWISINKGESRIVQHGLGFIPRHHTIQIARELDSNGNAEVIYFAKLWSGANNDGRGVFVSDVDNQQFIVRSGSHMVYDTFLSQGNTNRVFFESGFVRIMLWN